MNELDIRGLMTDEADLQVDQFLDSAVMGKLNVVTIIHGKGTGALRKAVHQQLKRHPSVKSFRLGRYGEGGRRRHRGGAQAVRTVPGGAFAPPGA